MQTLVKNAFVGLCFSVSILLVLAAPARAQVVAHSGDVAGYAGYFYVSDVTTPDGTPVIGNGGPGSNNHGIFGANGGYNVTPYITVLGDFSYVPLYSSGGDTVNTQLYGGGVRFNLNPKSRVVGYGIFTIGGDRLSASDPSGSESADGYSISVGGGASYYLGSHWGIRPEFRYVRPEYSYKGASLSVNTIAMTGGIFYQWGGHGKTVSRVR